MGNDDNVVPFPTKQKQETLEDIGRRYQTARFNFTISVFNEGEFGMALAWDDKDGLEVAERCRVWASYLEKLAAHLRENASQFEE